jgi:hypothetical protein
MGESSNATLDSFRDEKPFHREMLYGTKTDTQKIA